MTLEQSIQQPLKIAFEARTHTYKYIYNNQIDTTLFISPSNTLTSFFFPNIKRVMKMLKVAKWEEYQSWLKPQGLYYLVGKKTTKHDHSIHIR